MAKSSFTVLLAIALALVVCLNVYMLHQANRTEANYFIVNPNSPSSLNKPVTLPPGWVSVESATSPDQWKADYISRFNRQPPENYTRWITYAEKNHCPTALDPYLQIYLDLDPWFKLGRIHPESIWPVAQYKVTVFNGSEFHGQYPRNFKLVDLFQDTKPFTFAINGPSGKPYDYDEPRIIRSDDPMDVFPYKDMNDIFLRSECFRKRFDTPSPNDTFLLRKGQKLRDLHGFFMQPASFVVDNFRAPILSQTKLDCFDDILAPLSYHTEIATTPVNDVIKWEEKQNAVFWRGTTTGGVYRQGAPWRKYPRTMLAKWAKDYETKHPKSKFDTGKGERSPTNVKFGVDVALMGIVQHDEVVKAAIMKEFELKSRVSFLDTMKYKYLLVVDGNSWPSRLQSYLQTNSVILYNGIFTDFYNRQLVPMVHYVPIKADFSDLEEKLNWLVKNDGKAREIAENGKALLKRVSEYRYLQCYTGLMLMEYQRLYGVSRVV
ncbi:UNVERIFIED_CONTAM: capsule-associated protein CAP1 [Siphonaria sp. JEL0065]|nr:capsule-associated protein CAP1 [Siphonaria sp. JEL0065]